MAKHRTITVDGEGYRWVVGKHTDGTYTKRQVWINPVNGGPKVCAHLGVMASRNDWDLLDDTCEAVAVTPKHVADYIRANKEKFQ